MGVINPVNRFQETVSLAFQDLDASMANGEFIQTPWIDFANVDKYQINFNASATGLTLTLDSRTNANQTTASASFDYTASTLFTASFAPRQRFMRFTLTNNTGVTVTDVSFEVKSTVGSSDKASVFPLSIAPRDFSPAVLVQSVSIGKDYNGTYRTTSVNTGGAILTADFGTDVALGKVTNFAINTKFGRNTDIDTSTTPQDIWSGIGSYTGFNCIVAQTLSVVSDDANDRGFQLSSGTANTSSGGLILVDDAANFTGDGVDVGDMIINDTQQFHGVVASVDSDTQLTVYEWYDGDALNDYSFSEDDVYRVVDANDTGAAVIKLKGLDGSYNEISEYVILNGITPVTTTKTYIRQSRATVELAGSSETNEGQITARQSTTTANITMVIPVSSGQAAIACDTIPSGKVAIVKGMQCAMVRSGGLAGSAQMQFQVRSRGGAWQTKRFQGVTSSFSFDERLDGGIVIDEQSDVRWRVQSVSDNNTQATGLFEYFLIDK